MFWSGRVCLWCRSALRSVCQYHLGGRLLRAVSGLLRRLGSWAGFQLVGVGAQRAALVLMLLSCQAWVSEWACWGVMGSIM
jgi:hypothetical protein